LRICEHTRVVRALRENPANSCTADCLTGSVPRNFLSDAAAAILS
jgi:hypothetical protein